MENLPMIVVAVVGAILALLIVLYIFSQKKQDKKDAENTQKMLENLDIDIKDASEDIEEAIAEEDALNESSSGVALGVDSVGEVSDKTSPTRKPHEKTDVAIDEKKVEITWDKPDEDADSSDDFKMMDNQNEFVVEIENASRDDSFDLDFIEKPLDEPVIAKSSPVLEEEVDSEMSELDALFEATSDVEDMVASAQKSTSMFKQSEDTNDGDIEDDLLEIDFDDVVSPVAEKVVAPKIQPQTKPTPDVDPDVPPPMDPEDLARHEKARRIARVIVNDIRNYNPDNLAEGIRIGNIMKTLGKEVERGRLLYVKRVPPEIAKETNYYREALIKILADGQPDLLGL